MSTHHEHDIIFEIYTTVNTVEGTEWRKVADTDPEIGIYHIINHETCQWETYFTLTEVKSRLDNMKNNYYTTNFKRVLLEFEEFDDQFWE